MAMAYVPFAPAIPYYLPPPRHNQSSRHPAPNTGYYPSMTYTQRSSLPTGPLYLPPIQSAPSWRETQSCLFGTSFPADLSAALPVSSQKPTMTFLPEADFSPLGALTTGTDGLSSPSDTCASSETGISPTPDFVHAVCNAPLVAPVPLPYHSPTFLQFDLPDDDEDLSHPPYVSRPHKRKRSETEIEDLDVTAPIAVRRRVNVPAVRSDTKHSNSRYCAGAPAVRYPLQRWPVQPGALHGTGMPG